MASNFNIWPDSVIRTDNADGSTTTSRLYSFDAYKNNGFIVVICIIFLIAAFGVVFGPLLLLAYTFDVSDIKTASWTAALAALVSIYFLIDINHGWFLSTIALLYYENIEKLIPFVYLNGAAALTSIVCLLYGYKIYLPLRLLIESQLPPQGHTLMSVAKIRICFLLIISLIFLISWVISYTLISLNIIKII
jgi:hypothetical protein